MFSARYGNVYTSRQLVQLMQRSYGMRVPLDNSWVDGQGAFLDPFRPILTPGGYHSQRELDIDREGHFAAVREMFEQADVFIFTLGLTETWLDRRDGTVYPVCPGTAAGTFDDAIHGFHNLTYEDVIEDMAIAIGHMRQVNPSIKVLLCVSPVSMVATATEKHILEATVYSKSVLRITAEKMMRDFENVYYFPSYELITGAQNKESYYSEDAREVSQAGVDHVMQRFFKHYCGIQNSFPRTEVIAPVSDKIDKVSGELCEEEFLDRMVPTAP